MGLLYQIVLSLILGPRTALYVPRPGVPEFYGSDDCNTLFYASTIKDTRTLFVGGTTWSKKLLRSSIDGNVPCYSDSRKRAILLKRTIDTSAVDESADYFYNYASDSTPEYFNTVTALHLYNDNIDGQNNLMVVLNSNSLSYSELTSANVDTSKIFGNMICITPENIGTMDCTKFPNFSLFKLIITSYHFTQPTCCFRDDNLAPSKPLGVFSKLISHNKDLNLISAVIFCPKCTNKFHWMALPNISPLEGRMLFTCLFEIDEVHCLGPALQKLDNKILSIVYLIQKPALVYNG